MDTLTKEKAIQHIVSRFGKDRIDRYLLDSTFLLVYQFGYQDGLKRAQSVFEEKEVEID